MKALGIALLIIGSIAAIASFSMDVSVATGYGNSVNNIGLMSDRQNFILISCFIIMCGLLVVIFSKNSQELAKCPYCAEDIRPDAIKCKHCKSYLEKRKIQPSVIDYSFTLSNYDPKELVGIKNGIKVINEYAIKKLIFELKKNNPKTSGTMLKLKYNDEIYQLSSKLPENIRDEFIRKIFDSIAN
ncbi:hypothetical protein [Providencia rettgeri]|uniref:hypothetical protein n=1 Tax=Providencia rettgeri TaxID=587 RepID=UPI0015EC3E21|nr:hypothetical protein [Providencia rettgeri]QLR06007.1 hypothetical protein H0913_06585 [Providencia rettgeri]